MGEFFRNTTPYTVLPGIPLPDCFDEVERGLLLRPRAGVHPLADPLTLVTHNLCHRMGDFEFYADRIRDELAHPRGGTPPVLSSLLVGQFASAKAVLDAGAIALALLFDLRDKTGAPIALRDQDFAKTHFRNLLRGADKERGRRYGDFEDTFREIVDWRDASLHRVAPLVTATMRRVEGQEALEHARYHFSDATEVDFERLIGKDAGTRWNEALDAYERWRPRLLVFCAEVCIDVKRNIDREFPRPRLSVRSSGR